MKPGDEVMVRGTVMEVGYQPGQPFIGISVRHGKHVAGVSVPVGAVEQGAELTRLRDDLEDAQRLAEALECRAFFAERALEKERADKARLREALASVPKIADEIWDQWDNGMKAGKLLAGLAGRVPNYRADIAAIYAALASASPAVQREEG